MATERTADVFWAFGRVYMGIPARVLSRGRAYGRERVPSRGGVVLASNHLHWIDVPLLGGLSPRNIAYVAKVEAVDVPALGEFLRWHGTIAVRRGESDREAVRQMRLAAREGRALGLVVPVGIYGTQFWKPGNFAPCSVAFGRTLDFSGLPKGGRGYREATAEIERAIHGLFDWLADVHARGRPRDLTPP
jgi:1-acyl-sn-glycerol-3-phosphate acyltransferase